jgi:hypothetical protein
MVPKVFDRGIACFEILVGGNALRLLGAVGRRTFHFCLLNFYGK